MSFLCDTHKKFSKRSRFMAHLLNLESYLISSYWHWYCCIMLCVHLLKLWTSSSLGLKSNISHYRCKSTYYKKQFRYVQLIYEFIQQVWVPPFIYLPWKLWHFKIQQWPFLFHSLYCGKSIIVQGHVIKWLVCMILVREN